MRHIIQFSAILLLIGFISTPVLADEESLASQAEEAGKLRQALTHYVEALQSTYEGSSKDQRLREKIIKLAQKIQPPPAVPDEVINYEGRAEAAVRYAKKPDDYLDAAKEYKKALRLAPWVASYYFNLGVVLEKAGKPKDAIYNLKLYLLAAPDAHDAREVKKKIAGLEYEIEKKTRATEKTEALSGRWYARDWNGNDLRIENNKFVFYSPKPSRSGEWGNHSQRASVSIQGNSFQSIVSDTTNCRYIYNGTIDGAQIRGVVKVEEINFCSCANLNTQNFQGAIWPEYSSIMLTTQGWYTHGKLSTNSNKVGCSYQSGFYRGFLLKRTQ